MYSKPHLSFEDQLDLLKSRGLECSDNARAMDLLIAVGYYRLSAYVYPFRILLPENAPRSSRVHYRGDNVGDGVTMEHVEALWRFDRSLRLMCLDAIESIEIGMRTRLSYVLGARDPFGHLNAGSLDADACREFIRPLGKNAFDVWMQKYRKLLKDAAHEDYVVHHLAKHGDDDRMPIWIAVEFFDLGALVRLFRLLDKTDQNEIAKGVGISGGRLLAAWLRDISYLRNMCAHHSRLWNRSLTYTPRKFNPKQVEPELRHASQSEPRDKIYVLLAIVAYLVTRVDPTQRWPSSALRPLLAAFPTETGLSPESDMGFPRGWENLPLWRMP